MGSCWYISVCGKSFFIGKASRGCMFLTNIFGWRDLALHLNKYQNNLYSDILLLCNMCNIAKNTEKKWDGLGFNKSNARKTFTRIIRITNKLKGIAVDEWENSLSLDFIYECIFLSEEYGKPLNHSQYKPESVIIPFYNYSILDKTVYNKYKSCRDCRNDVKKISLCKCCSDSVNYPKNEDLELIYEFTFSHHIIAGVNCSDTSESI